VVEDLDRQLALATFRRSPVGFATRVLGVTPELHQAEILNSIRDRRRTLVVSCNSIGKDFIAGVATHWWLQIWEEALVITTAPTGEQVKNIQWKEIRTRFERSLVPLGGSMPEIEPVYRINTNRRAFGISTRDESERLSGHHEAHILIIITEGSAVSDEAYEGLRSLMASGNVRLLVLTNPTRNEGEVWEICQGNRAGWNIIRISGWDMPNLKACQGLGEEHMALTAEELEIRDECPNPTPFLLTHFFEAETRDDFGAESDYYAIHVLGAHGKTGSDQLIPCEWVELAFERDSAAIGKAGGGLDISRSGRDHTCYMEVRGDTVVQALEWAKLEVTKTEGRIRNEILADSPDIPIAVDDTGLGGGVAPHLHETHPRVYGIDFSEKADNDERFVNKPSEMYWRVRARLDPDKEDALSLRGVPQSMRKKVIRQFVMPITQTEDSKGRLKIDKRGGKGKHSESPDTFDALALALEAQLKGTWSGLALNRPVTEADKEDRRDGLAQFAGIRSKTF